MFYQPMIDHILLEGKVNAREVVVFILIARHMDQEGKKSYPSTATLAFILKIDRRSVQRSLKRLTALGYLKAFPWRRRSTMYELGDSLKRFLRKES